MVHDDILPGEEIRIFVNVVLTDSDGTAQTVSAILTQNGKEYVFELEKEKRFWLMERRDRLYSGGLFLSL